MSYDRFRALGLFDRGLCQARPRSRRHLSHMNVSSTLCGKSDSSMTFIYRGGFWDGAMATDPKTGELIDNTHLDDPTFILTKVTCKDCLATYAARVLEKEPSEPA